MEFLISFLNTLLPLLYLVTIFLYGMYFFGPERLTRNPMLNLFRVTVGIHFMEIILRWYYYNHFPLASVYEAFSTLALAAALIYLYLEIRLKVKSTGFFIIIIVLVLQLFSSAFINFTHDIPEILQSPLFIAHTSAAIIGYTGFIISFIYGLMYLLLFYNIKKRRFGVIYDRLPSLEVLAKLCYNSAALGFLFLTIAIILGFVWSFQLFGKFLALDPKIIVAYLTWIIYGLELFGGKFLNWSKKRLAYLSISGFLIIIFSMIFVNLFLTSFHEFK